MKKICLFLSVVLLLSVNIMAQTAWPKAVNNKDYQLVTLFNVSNGSVGDTSDVYVVPQEVTTVWFYNYADTVTSGDSIKTIVVEGSPDNSKWKSLDTLTALTTAGTMYKKVISNVDKYLRVRYSVGGAAVAIDFWVKMYAIKSYR